MLISNRHRFLYFVAPKCGSATARKSLADFSDAGWPVSNYRQHVTVDNFLASADGHLVDSYFKFTFVRNPYDRLYSGYLQDRFAAEHYPKWTAVKQPIFDELGHDFIGYFHKHVAVADIRSDWQWICFCPLSEFARSSSGHVEVDFVGKAESLEEDLARLGRRLNLPIKKAADENVRTTKCMPEPKHLDKYDRRTIRAVNELYEADFKLFGYEMLAPEDFPAVITQVDWKPASQ